VAILHRASITPTKLELAAAWLDRQGIAAGDVELAGSYRFDDPDGEVGVEALLVRRAGEVFHLPVTYRGAPLDGAEAHLVTTMEHSVLGRRWVYDAAADPVALACYAAALAGRQDQASLEVWDGDTLVGQRPHTVTLTTEGDGPAGREVRLYRVPGDLAGRPAAGRCLVAAWESGSGVVAAAVSLTAGRALRDDHGDLPLLRGRRARRSRVIAGEVSLGRQQDGAWCPPPEHRPGGPGRRVAAGHAHPGHGGAAADRLIPHGAGPGRRQHDGDLRADRQQDRQPGVGLGQQAPPDGRRSRR
jgi:hypothetical protein